MKERTRYSDGWGADLAEFGSEGYRWEIELLQYDLERETNENKCNIILQQIQELEKKQKKEPIPTTQAAVNYQRKRAEKNYCTFIFDQGLGGEEELRENLDGSEYWGYLTVRFDEWQENDRENERARAVSYRKFKMRKNILLSFNENIE